MTNAQSAFVRGGSGDPRDESDGSPRQVGVVPGEDRLPFTGIRVMEFGVNAAGPLVGKLLADFGAEVITIENREHIIYRGGGRQPSAKSANLTSMNLGLFANKYNFNKLSLALNMKRPQGLEVARKLVSVSDVVIDSFRPDALEKWGMTYDELARINPRIIMLRMPTMGEGGPYRYFRSTSWILMGLAGLNWASGFKDRPPVCPCANSLPDVHCNPFHAAFALVGALYHRSRTGKGQFIELSQFESTVCVTETAVFEHLAAGKLPERTGNRLANAAPHGVYRCRGDDKWCAIAVFDQTEWEALCRTMGRDDLLKDERFGTLGQRQEHADDLDRVIESWTGKRTDLEVMESLQRAGVAAGMVQNCEDLVVRDPQLRETGHWVTVPHPEAGKLIGEGWGFTFVNGPEPRFERPPLLGEHNDHVLGHILKMPEDEINHLIIDGVID
ncbi:MAG: CoA transferase [Chloroflexi bacterium]|nr:CoA transferase [Chloroflexota bacterium]